MGALGHMQVTMQAVGSAQLQGLPHVCLVQVYTPVLGSTR